MAENTVTRQAPHQMVETTRNNKYFTPRVDIHETPTELMLLADLPGVSPGDVELRYEQGELILQGRTKRKTHEGNLIFAEYEEGDYYRVFQIHETIDSSRIEAEFKNGVLMVHLPKAEKAKPKQVPVKVQ